MSVEAMTLGLEYRMGHTDCASLTRLGLKSARADPYDQAAGYRGGTYHEVLDGGTHRATSS